MLIQIILAILIGIIFGIVTGLVPGIHINLIGVILVSTASTIFFNINPIYLIVFIVSLSITHTFLDFIPSIFLGCPDTDTELSILPGHEFLKKGLGYQAVMLTIYGSIAAIFILLIIALPSIKIFPKIFELTQNILPFILIGISIILILLEKRKLTALLIFILTGILGYFVLNIETINQPVLPLLTGLFGSSMLIQSIKNKVEIPEQKIISPKENLLRPLLGAIISAPLCSFLPGLGSGQAAVIGNTIIKQNKRGFLILLGATNTLVMGFSFITLYLFSKTRTGSALAIKEIIGTLQSNILILILITTLFAGITSFFIAKEITKRFSKNINKINYTKISTTTLIILITITLIISKIPGLIILIISTITGIYCINKKVKRTNMMGCLIIPTIIFYLSI